eukprot:1136647-Pelagomonas_calceolata.AAC.3
MLTLLPALWRGTTKPSVNLAGVHPVLPMAVKRAARMGAMDSLQQDQSSAGIPSGSGDLLRWVRLRARRTSSIVILGAPAAAAVEGRREVQLAAIVSSTAWRLVGLQRGL